MRHLSLLIVFGSSCSFGLFELFIQLLGQLKTDVVVDALAGIGCKTDSRGDDLVPLLFTQGSDVIVADVVLQ